MNVTQLAKAPRYEAPGHFDMRMVRLQGREAGPSEQLWMGLSWLLPGGHTTLDASPIEKHYVVVEGELTVIAERDGLRERLARYHDDVDVAFWQWNDVWLSPAFRDFDIRGEIGAIGAPLLAIQGIQDQYGTMAQIDEVARAVPQTELVKLPDCGHSPHRDQPQAVNAAIAAFLHRLQG